MPNKPGPETPSTRRFSARLAKLADGKRAAEDDSPKTSPRKKERLFAFSEGEPSTDSPLLEADVSPEEEKDHTESEDVIATIDVAAIAQEATAVKDVPIIQADQADQTTPIAENLDTIASNEIAKTTQEHYKDLSVDSLIDETGSSVTIFENQEKTD